MERATTGKLVARGIRRGARGATAMPHRRQFRRRAWRVFQRALDPLAPPKAAAYEATRGEPRERRLAAEQLDALEEAGRDLRPRHGDRGSAGMPCRGFSPRPSARRTKRRLDRLGSERLELRERVACGRAASAPRRRARRGRLRRPRRGSRAKAGNSSRRAIFSCTSGAACARAPRPSRSPARRARG